MTLRTMRGVICLPGYLLVGLVIAASLVLVYGFDEAVARSERES